MVMITRILMKTWMFPFLFNNNNFFFSSNVRNMNFQQKHHPLN